MTSRDYAYHKSPTPINNKFLLRSKKQNVRRTGTPRFSPLRNGNFIVFNIAIKRSKILRQPTKFYLDVACKAESLNRCYTFFLQEKMP